LREREKLVRIKSLLEETNRDDFTSDLAWQRQQDINQGIKEIIVATLEDTQSQESETVVSCQ
jgi:hypothetical protein